MGVVSSVDGHAIAADEVAELASTGQLAPMVALRRLQAERLLAAEAERRGYAARAHTASVERQASVQALLAQDVESDVISQAELELAYTQQKARFDLPERRRSTHLLAELPKTPTPEQERAARAYIQQAITRLVAANGSAEVWSELRREHVPGLKTIVEELPAAPASGTFVPEFSRALFSLTQPGVVPEPVRTSFGYHAVVVSELLPATHTPPAEAQATLRTELEAARHKQRFDALLKTLQRQTPVSYAADTATPLAALDF